MSTEAAAVELQAKDLSPTGETYCPNPKAGMKLWDTHPRVFLSLSHGEARCPYCGTVYRLRAGEALSAGH
ncbi:MAG: zinc-finger domain-containing protein [Pseudomonadota bacterium]|nr:zinc-finger domain-containing protein [Pseudomonadota bacterium]